MKKQRLLCRLPILFFAVLFWSACQNQSTLGEVSPENISTVDSLNRLAFQSSLSDSIKLVFAQEALEKSRSVNYLKGIADACQAAGEIQSNAGNFFESKNLLDSALIIRKNSKDSFGLAGTMNSKGNLFIQNGYPDSAQKYFAAAFLILNSLETNASFLDDNTKRLKKIADINIGLANTAFDLNEPTDSVINIIQKSINFYETTNDSIGLVRAWINVGKSYYDSDSLSEANIAYEKAENISTKINFEYGLTMAQNGLGAINFDLENYEEAEDYFQKAKTGFEKLELSQNVFDADLNLCLTWLYSGDSKKAKGESEIRIRPVFETDERLEDKESAAGFYAQFYFEELYEKPTNDLLDSLDKYLELEYAFMNQQLTAKKVIAVSKANVFLNSKLKDQRIKTITNESRNKNYLLVAGFIALLSLFGFFIQYRRRQHSELKNKDLELNKMLQNAESEAVNSVMSAIDSERIKIARKIHDKLGSSLVVVNQGLKTFFKDSEEVALPKSILESYTENLDEVYNDLREISHQLEVQANYSLTDKIEKFCALSTIAGNLKVEFEKSGDFSKLTSETKNELFFISKEIITNILKHAKAKTISIQLLRLGQNIHLVMIDDGIGFDIEQFTPGIGLKNIEKRVNALGGTFHIDSTPEFGTTVMIDIPK